uniref:ankyrin repeat and SAM domain-containing protein 1A-like isoform X3 n=1 Tax=Myxine glutinosa TaxID=7769 RepID=UPI00358F6F42
MGREQDLLEAARTGKVALVDKLLSGKRGPSAGKAVQPLSELLHSIWRGPNVNCVDCSGFTPLHHAALNGHKEIVLKLLQHEASPNIADEKGCFPLHLAAWKGDVEIVRVLIQLGPSHKINDQNQDDSCEIKRHGPFDPYVNAKNAKHETALHCAAEHGNTDVVSVLLEELADPTLRNSHFQTPLDLAACYGRIDVVGMLITAHPELMSSGGTVLQHTPLHLAARNGHKHVVQALLQAGMDVNMRSENGSALHEAALYGKEEVVRLLLQSGIDVNIKDKQSNKALDILKDHPSSKRIAQLLNVDFAEMREDTESDRAAVEPDNTYEELCSAISARIPPRNTLAKTPMKMHLMKKERPPPPSRPPPENSIDMDTQPDHWFPGVESARHMLIVTESENPYELLSAAETKVPHCHGLPKSADEFVLPVSSSDECINASSTPDYSPPSPATALHNIDSVIRPQPRQRVTLTIAQGGPTERNEHERDDATCAHGTMDAESTSFADQGAEKLFEEVPQQFEGLLYGSCPNAKGETDKKPQMCQLPMAEIHTKDFAGCNVKQDKKNVSGNATAPCPYKTELRGNLSQTGVSQKLRSTHMQQKLSQKAIIPQSSLEIIKPMHPVPEMEVFRGFSKSDSDLLMPNPWSHRDTAGALVYSCSHDNIHTRKYRGRGQRPPSFQKEWEEIDRIMSSIGAGIRKDDVLVQKEEAVKKGVQSPAQTVGQWLESLGIQQYESQLVANGFDDINFLGNAMEDQDLLEIGILNSSHRQKLLQAARMLPKVRRIGYDGYHPSTVAEWLDSLELRDYLNTFTMNGYSSMEQVKKLWEIELVNVLKIALVGHRKRVLASFGDRYDSSQQKPTRLNQMEECCEPSLVLRPPNEATPSAPIQQWQHQPEHLIFSSCDYEAYYLGSMLVKDLRGTDSTHEACVKMRKSTEEMKKIPTITLSITYKGVKFIDSLNKNTIAEHEIRNISCAAQDPEDLCTFAYITKDLKTSYHYCHVFSAFDVSLAYEIILTLGQAFEVAYQLALQARQAKASGMAEGPDIKLGKPVPKPRTSIRKSTVDSGCVDVMTQPHGSVAWGSEPLQESKKITSTNPC